MGQALKSSWPTGVGRKKILGNDISGNLPDVEESCPQAAILGTLRNSALRTHEVWLPKMQRSNVPFYCQKIIRCVKKTKDKRDHMEVGDIKKHSIMCPYWTH